MAESAQAGGCRDVVRGLPIVPETREFKFTVPWDSLDQTTIGVLDRAKLRNKRANPKDIEDLKKAIMRRVVASYKSFRTQNPEVVQKHPGRKVYMDIATQVKHNITSAHH